MIWNFFRWLAKYLGTFLTAFLLAIIVWVLAVINADPNITCPAPTSMPLNVLGRDPNLLLLQQMPETVAVQLRAPRSVCERLARNPGSVIASLDLSTLTSGEYSLKVIPQVSDEYRPVRVLSVTPDTINFTLEEYAVRVLPLRFEVTGDPAPGFTKGATVVGNALVTVSGRKTIVEQVVNAVVSLDITDAQQEIIEERPIVLLDAEGKTLTGLTLDIDTVTVQQKIERPSTYRDVTVKVVTSGQPAEGYLLTSITPFPQNVTVFSVDPQIVREMPGFVETTPITLTGATSNIEQRVFLNLPEGVSIAGEQSVLVQITISAIPSSRSLTMDVETIGLAPGLQAQIFPSSINIIISGPLPVLEALQPGDIRAVLDLTGLAPGQYTLVPRVELLPIGLRINSFLPNSLDVTITIPPSPTATSTPDPNATLTPTPTLPIPTPTPQ
ncbi:MAG TPA: CdaR family protein [Anaerolineales bacterium]|nr:CdaR family protein [Anaerolineales bacterium]